MSSLQNPVDHALFDCSLGTQKVIPVSFNLNLICGHASKSAQKPVYNLHSKTSSGSESNKLFVHVHLHT